MESGTQQQKNNAGNWTSRAQTPSEPPCHGKLGAERGRAAWQSLQVSEILAAAPAHPYSRQIKSQLQLGWVWFVQLCLCVCVCVCVASSENPGFCGHAACLSLRGASSQLRNW